MLATRTQSRHAALGLTDDQMREMYFYLLMTRRLDERLWLLQRSGKIHFVVSAQGQDAAQVGAAYALRRGYDWIIPYYRDLGKVLVMGMTARDIMLGAFARASDPSSNGRQLAHHWAHRDLNIVSTSSPVSTQIPHAAGIALAFRLRGEDRVTMTSVGEGSTNQGEFHEGLNFAGVHKLACIFHVQNNGYAISVPMHQQMACEHVADRGAGYGMPGIHVDGSDILAVYEAFRDAVKRARAGEGSTLIETKTVRLTAHSSDDDDKSYRSKAELEAERARDPMELTRTYMFGSGLLDAAGEQEMEEQIMAEIDEATAYAEAQPVPEPASALLHVYKEPH